MYTLQRPFSKGVFLSLYLEVDAEIKCSFNESLYLMEIEMVED